MIIILQVLITMLVCWNAIAIAWIIIGEALRFVDRSLGDVAPESFWHKYCAVGTWIAFGRIKFTYAG